MYHAIMPVMLQVRNLPDDVHAKLKERAASARSSLSDYVANLLAEHVAHRSNAEIFAEARARFAELGYTQDELRAMSDDATAWIRAERDARG